MSNNVVAATKQNCDLSLVKTFKGECDYDSNFFIKTHYPSILTPNPVYPDPYYKAFDQVVYLVRNPIDSIVSYYYFRHAPLTSEGLHDHERRVELPGGKFGGQQRDEILRLAREWKEHAEYWLKAKVLRYELRYEDLRVSTADTMMSLLAFLLPSDEVPSLDELKCLVEVAPQVEAYKSRKLSAFAAYHTYEPWLRKEVLEIHGQTPAAGKMVSISLALHAGGLIFIYSLYGILQERIMKGNYDGERFTSSSLLILCNRVFSIAVGVGILYYKSRGTPGEFRERLKPKSSFYAYAAVAVFNFLSTTCQYEALKYVSYTTQSLAKCAKMVPVLVVGYVVYKKSHKVKEWVAGGVILLGCATYLFAQPPVSKHPAKHTDDSALGAALGTLFLMGYLFFDGLVSTTQEKVFGKNPSSSDPFGSESPVLDQMIYTNLFAGLIALASALLTNVTGTLMPNVGLLLSSPRLLWDVCVFSGASAVGLIVLLNTIASYGALTSSLIMTTRQFLSILINAGVFGNFGSVSLLGWMGVGWVASGIWIKMNKKFDPPKPPKGAATARVEAEYRDAEPKDEEMQALAVEMDDLASDGLEPVPTKLKPKMGQYIEQYVIPILVPVFVALGLHLFLPAVSARMATPTAPTTSTVVDLVREPYTPPLRKTPPKGARVALVIAGMHRSGTSALTRTLSLLGAALPLNVLGANKGNLRGHWESEVLIKVDGELLRATDGLKWDSASSLSSTAIRALEANSSAIADTLKDEFGDSDFFVVKEPRICRLLDGYIPAFESMGVDARFVIPVRDPAEVAGSLHKRNTYMTINHATLLWMGYVLDAEEKSRNFPRVFTTYDELLTNWTSVAHRISTKLDVSWPNTYSSIAANVSEFISPTYRHQDHEKTEHTHQQELLRWTGMLYSASVHAAKWGDEKLLRDTVDAARPWFDKTAAVVDQFHAVFPPMGPLPPPNATATSSSATSSSTSVLARI
ncbi:adenosine 3'-phospho 5'-phosphosulfate transporter 1 [Pseudohyphozyma bogoriensis]|nr:adenosine 3'-phospho 5'-phosphosulfate transporter 1 [Pseudohyphozyma bogoriensis]